MPDRYVATPAPRAALLTIVLAIVGVVLAGCQTQPAPPTPVSLPSPERLFGLDLEPIAEPVLLRYRPAEHLAFRATRELVARARGATVLSQRDEVVALLHLKEAGEGLLRLTATFSVLRADATPELDVEPFQFVGLITDLGEVREGDWLFSETDRLTQPQMVRVVDALGDMWPLGRWPDLAVTPEQAQIFNRIGAAAPSRLQFELRGSRYRNGERALVFTFAAAPDFAEAAASRRFEELSGVTVAGYFAVDPELGFVTDFATRMNGAMRVAGDRVTFTVATQGVILRP
ncbi:MAG: hypothetical protein R3F55_14275 [Alphaproteobacteria bacterium]